MCGLGNDAKIERYLHIILLNLVAKEDLPPSRSLEEFWYSVLLLDGEPVWRRGRGGV